MKIDLKRLAKAIAIAIAATVGFLALVFGLLAFCIYATNHLIGALIIFSAFFVGSLTFINYLFIDK